jgi:SAM-dependent methyltransferase
MPKPCNLSSSRWAEVLEVESRMGKTVRDIKTGRMLPWVETLLSYTSMFDKTLDLGSGAGQNSAVLALNGRDTTLMDFSQGNIDFSHRLFAALGINGKFVNGDMIKRLPFEDDSFDTVFSCGVFEYFNDIEIVEILKECFRVSRNKVMIMVPNAASIAYRLGMWYQHVKGKWQWGGERPFYSMSSYLKKAAKCRCREFSIGTGHSLKFLTMPMGNVVRKAFNSCLRLKDDAKPSFFNQGYLLVSIAEKVRENHEEYRRCLCVRECGTCEFGRESYSLDKRIRRTGWEDYTARK